MRRRDLILGLATFAAAGRFAEAQAGGAWVFLGSRVVRWLGDFDVIHVGIADGRYDHILIKAKGNAIFIDDLDVTYSNGVPDHIPLRYHIAQGGSSRVINLRGGDRNIRRVTFFYRRPTNIRGPATVELWGQR